MKKYLTSFFIIVSLISGYFYKKSNISETTLVKFIKNELTLSHSK